MALWVKICGITRLVDARAAFEAGADAIGLNFWPSSKRYCQPDLAREIVAGLPSGALVFGVFVRASREEITATVSRVGLGGVQLHGGEAPEEAEGWKPPVIRAVSAVSAAVVRDALDWAREAAAKSSADGGRDGKGAAATPATPAFGNCRLLVDHASGGGSGQTIESDVLQGLDLSGAILAGGLTPHNVAASVARCRPFGVDTAGGVESEPGIKDTRAIEAFVRAARA